MRLNEALLTATRALMKETVGQAMELMMMAGSVSTEESKAHVPQASSDLQQIANLFSKEVEAICAADKRLGQLLASLMGVVSSDDIIQQRLDHILLGVRRLNEALVTLIKTHKSISIENVQSFRNIVLTDVYRAYTTNEEREVFHGVFGRPKRGKEREAA